METSLQTLIQSSKDEFLSNLVTSFNANPRKLFGYLNNLSQSKFKPQFIVDDGNNIADPIQKASLFNEFFNSTFTSSNYVLPTMSSLQTPTTQLSIIEFTVTEVFEVLINLDPTKAVGCDMISAFVIKQCADVSATPLCHLFNIWLDSSTIPQEWKIHTFCPKIYMKSITIVQFLYYVQFQRSYIERLIYNKIIDFIRPKLSKQQFRFLKNRSCLSQLFTSFAYIFDEVDRGTYVDVIYIWTLRRPLILFPMLNSLRYGG